APIEQVVPLMRRALKVLTDREVSPQLGLLKSTLLQLDSTFSERTYGVSSFRDFAQKLAAAGYVTVKESGRNVLVELAENPPTSPAQDEAKAEQKQQREDQRDEQREGRDERQPRGAQREGQPVQEAAGVAAPRTADGIREVRRLFQAAQNPPRWPMYIRQAKQFMRNVDATFDERKFGFSSLVDLLRACQRDGLFRMERDRQGVIRLFPGTIMQGGVEGSAAAEPAGISTPRAPRPWQPGDDIPDIHEADRPDPPAVEVVEGDVVQEMEMPPVIDAEPEPQEDAEPVKKGRGRAPRARSSAAAKAPRGAKEPRAKKTAGPAKARMPRAKKSTE
nr:hypothetical protein [Acidobacteriota bacterium]